MPFIAREREQRRLCAQLASAQQSATLIYGRRRVGKSDLVLHCLGKANARTIYYECRQTTEASNVKGFADVLAEAFNVPRPSFSDFEEALRFMFERACSEHIVLAIDEYPYLRDAIPGMDSILQVLLDTYRDRAQLSIILCGSYVAVMKSLLEQGNPLYGRIDMKIDLKPMAYYDAAKFYPSFSNEDKVRLYSVFGGIPYYNRLIDSAQSVRENIIRLLIEPDARLEDEVPGYLLSELSKIGNAHEAFLALADGYTRYTDILAQSHIGSGATLLNVLNKLMGMQLVERRTPINDPKNRRKASYVICDPLSSFYYRYVYRYASQRTVLDSEVFYERFIQDDFEQRFVPHAFEGICRQYLIRQNRSGRIDPPFNTIGTYWYDDPETHTNGEFDVVTEDPLGYVFYEAKFRSTPMTEQMIQEEKKQVRRTGLRCHRYGFISRSGFTVSPDDSTALIDLDQLFEG